MTVEPGRIPMDDPLAFFLTWTTYGTWLPGDERGWVAKPGRFQAPDAKRKTATQPQMTAPACHLGPDQRRLVEKTIADHCVIRGWPLHVVRCGMNHVHVVVTAPQRDPEDVMDQFNAWCTRRLKEQQRAERVDAGLVRQNWWTQRGSKRQLYDEASLEAAIRFLEGQEGSRFEPERPHKDTGPPGALKPDAPAKPDVPAKDTEHADAGKH